MHCFLCQEKIMPKEPKDGMAHERCMKSVRHRLKQEKRKTFLRPFPSQRNGDEKKND